MLPTAATPIPQNLSLSLSLQSGQAVFITASQRLPHPSRNPNKQALSNILPSGNRVLITVGEITRGVFVGNANLQSRVCPDEPVVDLIDYERLVGFVGEVVALSKVDRASVDGCWDCGGTVGVGEVDYVDRGTRSAR